MLCCAVAGAAAPRDNAGAAALPAGDPMEDDALLQEALAMSMQVSAEHFAGHFL